MDDWKAGKNPPAINLEQLDLDPDLAQIAAVQAARDRQRNEHQRIVTELEKWKERAQVAERLADSLQASLRSTQTDFSSEREEAREQHRLEKEEAREQYLAMAKERDYHKERHDRLDQNLRTFASMMVEFMRDSDAKKHQEESPLEQIVRAGNGEHGMQQ